MDFESMKHHLIFTKNISGWRFFSSAREIRVDVLSISGKQWIFPALLTIIGGLFPPQDEEPFLRAGGGDEAFRFFRGAPVNVARERVHVRHDDDFAVQSFETVDGDDVHFRFRKFLVLRDAPAERIAGHVGEGGVLFACHRYDADVARLDSLFAEALDFLDQKYLLLRRVLVEAFLDLAAFGRVIVAGYGLARVLPDPGEDVLRRTEAFAEDEYGHGVDRFVAEHHAEFPVLIPGVAVQLLFRVVEKADDARGGFLQQVQRGVDPAVFKVLAFVNEQRIEQFLASCRFQCFFEQRAAFFAVEFRFGFLVLRPGERNFRVPGAFRRPSEEFVDFRRFRGNARDSDIFFNRPREKFVVAHDGDSFPGTGEAERLFLQEQGLSRARDAFYPDSRIARDGFHKHFLKFRLLFAGVLLYFPLIAPGKYILSVKKGEELFKPGLFQWIVCEGSVPAAHFLCVYNPDDLFFIGVDVVELDFENHPLRRLDARGYAFRRVHVAEAERPLDADAPG